MIEEIARVFCFLVAGEMLARTGMLPIPGSVIGLVLLYANLLWIGRVPDNLGPLADRVLQCLGLFFVPPGVGVLMYVDLLRADVVAVAAALVGGTLITATCVATLTSALTRPQREEIVHRAP